MKALGVDAGGWNLSDEADDETASEAAKPGDASSAAEATPRPSERRTARKTTRTIAENIRVRAAVQRRQSTFCLVLVALLLTGGGVFFYFAQSIALAELRAQSQFFSNKQANIDADKEKIKTKRVGIVEAKRDMAARASVFAKCLSGDILNRMNRL